MPVAASARSITATLAGLRSRWLAIIVGQAPKILRYRGGRGAFFAQLWRLLTHLGGLNGWTLAIGLSGLATLLFFRRFAPGLPSALIVVVAGIAVTALFGLADRALAITVIGYAESDTVSEEFAEEHRYTIRPDQELIALGATNLATGLFQGFISGGGASQSAANDRAGAKTQVAGLIVAALIFLTAVALLPLFRDLPDAILGAIVISAVLGFLRVNELRRVWGLRRDSFVLALVALAGVLILGVMPGLLLTIALSILLLLGRLSRPVASVLGRLPDAAAYVDVERHPEAAPEPGLLIFRLDAQLLFINATMMRDRLRALVAEATPPPRAVLVDLAFSDDLDIKGVDTLARLHEQLAEDRIELWLAEVRGPAADMLRRSGAASAIGESRVYHTIEEALAAYRAARREVPAGGG